MKSLFTIQEDRRKKELAKKGVRYGMDTAIGRINKYFIPILQDANSPLEVRFRTTEKVRCSYALGKYQEWNGVDGRLRKDKSGILCEIFPRDNIKRSILVQVAVRIGRTDIVNYPRFHMPSDIIDKNELWNLLSEMNIYFCILTIEKNTGKPTFFRFNRFDAIPKENFKLISRGKGRRKDRLVPYGKKADDQRSLYPVGKDGKALIDAIQHAVTNKYHYQKGE